jgi:hypothetical protein
MTRKGKPALACLDAVHFAYRTCSILASSSFRSAESANRASDDVAIAQGNGFVPASRRRVPSEAAKMSKRDALQRHGTLNPHPDAVTDPLFEAGDFFDRDDLLQLKYEMLRRVTVNKQSVTQSATAFGFLRPTYYQAEADFQRDGLFGLLPEKRGPRQGHKLTPEVLDFALQLRRAILRCALKTWPLLSRNNSL